MKVFLNLLVLALFCSSPVLAQTQEKKNIQLIKDFFHAIFESETFKPETAEKYLSKDYKQFVDGNSPLDYQGFIDHILAQKKIIPKAQITFVEFVAQGNKVTEIHLAKATKKNKEVVEAKVIAVWTLRNGKIIKCEELIKMIKGSKEDENLGHIK